MTLSLAVLLSFACGSHDDVVATVVDVVPDTPSGSLVAVGTAGSPVAVGGTQTGDAPISGTSRVVTNVPLPVPPFVPPDGAVLVSGTPRPVPSGDAEPWPFRELLSDVFGPPMPGARPLTRIEADPIRAEALRRLGQPYGFEPGVAAAMLIVVDAIDEQYDVTIWEPE